MQEGITRWRVQRAQAAISRQPNDPVAWSRLYALCSAHDLLTEFAAFCRAAIKQAPANQQPWNFLQLSGHLADVRDAAELQFAQELVRRHPESERAWQHLDRAFASGHDPADLVAFCHEITRQHRDNLFAWTRLVQVFKKQARHADLAFACLSAIRLQPRDAQTWCNLADAYAAQSKYDQAIAAYRQAIDLKPNHVVAWNSLGCTYQTVGQLEEAVACYQTAIKLQPDDVTPWVWLTMAHLQLGHTAKAEETIGEVRKKLPIVAAMLAEEINESRGEPQESDPNPVDTAAINQLLAATAKN